MLFLRVCAVVWLAAWMHPLPWILLFLKATWDVVDSIWFCYCQNICGVRQGDMVNFEKCLEAGESINVTDYNGRTALIIACREGHMDIAKLCLHYSCDVNLSNKQNWCPLHFVCRNRSKASSSDEVH